MAITMFIIFFTFAFLYLAGKRIKIVQLAFISVVLALIAAFRPANMPDWISYWLFWNDLDGERFEFGFTFLADILKKFSSNFNLFLFCCAALSISLKIFAIYRMTPFVWGSLVVYLGQIFILQDMIQIRCGIASSFFLLAIYSKVNKSLSKFLIFSSLAFLFHYSAIIVFPLWFLSSNHLNKKLYIGLIICSYLLGSSLLIFNLIPYIPIVGIQELWSMYEHTMGTEDVNIWNIVQLIRIFVCFWIIFFIDKIYMHNKYVIVLLKIYVISVITFVVFAGVPTVAQRLSEFFQVVEFLLIPMLVYTLKCDIILKRICVVVFGLSFLLIHAVYETHLG